MKKNRAKVWALVIAAAIMLSALVPQMEAYAAPNEVAVASIGIDVSQYQGLIDWDQVAASGVQFAMIRVGYRSQLTGALLEDTYARYNLQEATRVGIKVGAYFYSAAITAEEVVEDAVFAANILDGYSITYPVAFDCEGYNNSSYRHYGLDKEYRTALAVLFLDTIAARGYTPMFYNSKSHMENNAFWNMTVLNKYKVWVAQYVTDLAATPVTTYTGSYVMWQYTNGGYVAGIGTTVDMNLALINYDGIAEPKNTTGTQTIDAASAKQISYTTVYDIVTPNVTELNLRTVPSTASDASIVAVLSPGAYMVRVGIGNDGWSQVIVGDQIYYAYTSYLTKVG